MTLPGVVIYDDFDFAARAAALLDRAAIRTDEAMKWDVKPWRLNVLKQPSPTAALGEILGADLMAFVNRLWQRKRTPNRLGQCLNCLQNRHDQHSSGATTNNRWRHLQCHHFRLR
jgi:hypothetical protein